jgi:hypothetical protein
MSLMTTLTMLVEEALEQCYLVFPSREKIQVETPKSHPEAAVQKPYRCCSIG